MYTSGSTTITGNTSIGGNLHLSGSIEVSGSFTGSMNIAGDVKIASGSNFYKAGNKLFNYGAFSDTTNQSASFTTASYAVKFDTTDYQEGINIQSGSQILISNTGVYNVQFSAQINRVGGNGTARVSFWLADNGTPIPRTCGDLNTTGNTTAADTVAAWNYVIPLTAGHYIQLMWCTADIDIQLVATATRTLPTRPAGPSVIISVTQVA
jgi:hypothetical protein